MRRDNMRIERCTADKTVDGTPAHIATSTFSDELKVNTGGRALVYSLAENQDDAILAAGHAADGAFWMYPGTSTWMTSSYYPRTSASWVRAYNNVNSNDKSIILSNDAVTRAALSCITDNALGRDEVTDYLAITLSASLAGAMGQRTEMEGVYVSLDKTIANLLSTIEDRIGKDNTLFMLTSTGYADEAETDYAKYKIPTGTFYINRTAQTAQHVSVGSVWPWKMG